MRQPVERGGSSAEARELKTERFCARERNSAAKSRPRSLKGLKSAHGWDVAQPFAYLESGRALPFLSSRRFPTRLRPCSLQPSARFTAAPSSLFPLCSPARPRPAISVMHPQTHPCSLLRAHTDASTARHHRRVYVDEHRRKARQTARVHTPGPKAPANTRVSPGVMQTQWQSLREQRNRS